jgi:hypothetical protein
VHIWQALLEELDQDADWSDAEAESINLAMTRIADSLIAVGQPASFTPFHEEDDDIADAAALKRIESGACER